MANDTLRCSCQSHNGPCPNPVVWVTGIMIGGWLCGVWLCDACKPKFEAQLPILFDEQGNPHQAGIVTAQIRRSGRIAPLGEIVANVDSSKLTVTCDRCSSPIYRQNGQWHHADALAKYDHEAIPG